MNECLNIRSNKILKILLERSEPITINKISEELNVSNRTIRNDLELLDDLFKQYGDISIQKKSGVGIWLECSKERLEFFKSFVYRNKSYIRPLSTEERKYYIIKQLIQATDTVKMQNLANDLYVSRITIHNDLKSVEEWLDKFDLKLIKKQNYGLQISGDEKNWRKAASELLSVLKSNEELKYMLNESNTLHYVSRLDYKVYTKIKELVPEIDLRAIEAILDESENIFELALTDEAFEGLLVHIAISIKRMNSRNDVKLVKEQVILLKGTKEYEIADWIAKKLQYEFNIEYPENETAYLVLHILGSKIQENVEVNNQNKIIESIEPELRFFTKEIINLASNILGHNLNNDERLFNGLILHLKPAINRMTYGLNLRNPLINEIKSKYPAIFGAAWATSALFEKYYNIKVSEEEIGYIAIHLGAALERINTSIKAIVVCSSGIGTCQLVAARLHKQISDLMILGTYSLYDLKSLKVNDFDIIISTIQTDYFQSYNKPIVKIAPFISDEDISKIKKVMGSIGQENMVADFNEKELLNAKNQLFYKGLIFLNEESKSKSEIILKVSEALVAKGYVVTEFANSVMAREKITSTAVGKGVAIPHGEQPLVNTSSIAIVTLKEPIDWSGEQVDILFLLALKLEDKNYFKSFFSHFYSILNDDEKLNSIRNSNNKDEILGMFESFK